MVFSLFSLFVCCWPPDWCSLWSLSLLLSSFLSLIYLFIFDMWSFFFTLPFRFVFSASIFLLFSSTSFSSSLISIPLNSLFLLELTTVSKLLFGYVWQHQQQQQQPKQSLFDHTPTQNTHPHKPTDTGHTHKDRRSWISLLYLFLLFPHFNSVRVVPLIVLPSRSSTQPVLLPGFSNDRAQPPPTQPSSSSSPILQFLMQ